MTLLLLLLACTDDAIEKDASATDSMGDTPTGETDSGGTTVEDADATPLDVTVTLSEFVGTVAIVTWNTAVPTTGFVEFGETGEYGLVTPTESEATTEHRVLLLGIPPETEAHLKVTAQTESGQAQSDDLTYVTAALPADVPTLTLTGEVQSWKGSYQVLPLQGTGFVVGVVDDQGRYVWYDVLEGGYNVMRAMLSHDGQYMIYCLAGAQGALDLGTVLKVSIDGSEQIILPFPYIDHDLTELPDGTLAGIVVTEKSGYTGSADTIVEMAPDGTMTEVWNAWDDETLMTQRVDNINWTHANALDYDPVEDVYYISSKEIGTLTKVDRKTGESLWHLNGSANDFTMLNGTEPVLEHHQFQMLEDGVLVFDNGLPERGYSQAVEMVLDFEAKTAEEVWTYNHNPPLEVFAKGDVERFSDGNTQVVWSTAGEIQNVDPSGAVHWQLNTELGYAITFVQRVESLYGH